jgi:hypothetical protein
MAVLVTAIPRRADSIRPRARPAHPKFGSRLQRAAWASSDVADFLSADMAVPFELERLGSLGIEAAILHPKGRSVQRMFL